MVHLGDVWLIRLFVAGRATDGRRGELMEVRRGRGIRWGQCYAPHIHMIMLHILHLHLDQVGLLTSALMEEDLSLEQEA